MKIGKFILSVAVTLGAIVAAQACSPAPVAEERVCTPGAYVFCRCADRTPGTKLCKSDGQSFEACTTGAAGECKGGEIDDPRTNEPLPDDPDDDPPPVTDGPLDACPGKSTAVKPGVAQTLEGDTTTATNDRRGRQGACAVGAGGKDHVYHLIPSGSGTLDVKVEGADGLDPVAYLRTACDDEESQVSCGPPGANHVAQLKTNVVTGRDYFLFVDGASGSAGKYVATVALTTGSFCGDGKVDSGEACDDGNKVQGDGCSNDCKSIDGDPPSGGGCDGHPVHLWPGKTVTGTGSNLPYGNAWSAPSQTCSTSGSNAFADHVYEVTPRASGTMSVTVTPKTGTTANFMLAARATCSDPATTLTCKNDFGNSASSETLSLAATKDKKMYVAVDGGGATGNTGEYTISFKLQ